MQKQIKILLTLLMALFLAVSCAKNNPNNPTKTKEEEMLQQKWQDNDTTWGISQYIITDSTFDSLYNDSVSYSFDIKYINWSSDTAGIIYGQYTANSYSQEVVGKYYAVSFKDLLVTK